MLSAAEAIIYLAEKRGCTQSSVHRCFHTFNFGDYHNENRKQFGSLLALNDETLKEKSERTIAVGGQTAILLLPLVGEVLYHTGNGVNGRVEAGEAHLLFFANDTSIQLTNPFESELINFLHIWFLIDTPADLIQNRAYSFPLNIDNRSNQLIELQFAEINFLSRIHIGKFNGRSEAMLSLKDTQQGAFVFIAGGAFEVNNRLLQQRDGLAIWNTNEIEWEALSNDAVLLIIE